MNGRRDGDNRCRIRIVPGGCWRAIQVVAIAFLLIGLCESASAERQRTFSISWGADALVRQDLLYGPNIANGFALINADVRIESRREHAIGDVEISFDLFRLASHEPYDYLFQGDTYSLTRSPFTFVAVSAGHHRFVGNSSLALGAAIASDIEAGNWIFGQAGIFSYHAYFSVESSALYELDFGDGSKLILGVRLPLAGWLSRSPFALADDTYIQAIESHNGVITFFTLVAAGRLTAIHHLQRVRLSATLHSPLTERLSVRATYRGEAQHIADIREQISYRHGLDLGISYDF